MSIIDDIRQKVDIVKYIGRDTALEVEGDHFKGLCPLPGHDDRTAATFFVYPTERQWKCSGACHGVGGIEGDVISYIQRMENLEAEAAINMLCAETGIDPSGGTASPEVRIKRPSFARSLVNSYMQRCLESEPAAVLYLQSLGLNDDDIKRWRIGAANGKIFETFRQSIDISTLIRIGIVDGERDEKDKLVSPDNVREYLRPGIITIPVTNDKGHISHWYLIEYRKGEQFGPTQMPEYQHDRGLFFNMPAAIIQPAFVVVEYPIEVVMIAKRGYHAIATMGAPTKKQCKWLVDLRERNIYFEELKQRKDVGIWFRRGADKQGQTSATTIANACLAFHLTSIWDHKGAVNPFQYLAEGGRVEDVERKIVFEKAFRVQMTDDGAFVETKDGCERVTDFRFKIIHKYRDEGGDLVRYAEVSKPGYPTVTAPVLASDLTRREKFKEWACAKGPFCVYGKAEWWDEVLEYIQYTDTSKEITVTDHYGNISPGLWVFDNGCLVNGNIVYADSNHISWVHTDKHQGIQTSLASAKGIDEAAFRLKIPKEFDDIGSIVRNFLKYYPPWIVRIALGWATAGAYCNQLARIYGCYPLLLFSGTTGHGKSKLTEAIQAIGGGAKIPTDSCTSTDKAFMAHMTAYCGFTVHMQDYSDLFMSTMRSIFDRVLYSKKRKTIKDETYDPIVNAAVAMTCENTPSGRSLINRCLYVDYNVVIRDEALAIPYDAWWGRLVGERRGFGFLKRIVQDDLTAKIARAAGALRKLIVSGNEKLGLESELGIESRIALNYAIVYGAFSVLYEMPEVRAAFDESGVTFGARDIVLEMRGIIKKAQSTSRAQGELDAFFSLFQTVFFQGRIGDMVQVAWDDESGTGTLKFQLDPVLNEVLAFDQRSGKKLQGFKKGDIESRIRKELRIDPEHVGGASFYTLPLEDLHLEYGVTFLKVDEARFKSSTPF